MHALTQKFGMKHEDFVWNVPNNDQVIYDKHSKTSKSKSEDIIQT